MKIYIETYGCWLNRADSDIIASILRESGHEIVDNPTVADAIVINTCAVRAETERKIAKRLKELETSKDCHSYKKIIVTGCLARARPAFIASLSPSASILGPNALQLVLDALREKMINIGPDKREDFKLPTYNGSSKRLVIPIAVGCLGSCSYCIMPISRGRLSSCPPQRVLELFDRALSRDVKEVYLVAQDIASYGLDIGTNLPSLLRALLKNQGDYVVRLGMMEPSTLAIIANELRPLLLDARVYKYLHLPMQSGSDRILKLMNRRYTIEFFVKLVDFFKSKIDVFLATDVIVGFPSETDEDFEQTCKALEKLVPDKVHVARYTMRPFTKASSLPQLSDHIKKKRSRILSELVEELTLKRNMRYVGKEVDVLLTDVAPRGGLLGRMINYRPVVVRCDRSLLWKKVTVVIEEAKPHILLGKVV
ncbi:MAG: tRNA (N(6)-L-threonylcarbamoyladenosine(37)-C(2))-methylthiotransferase [Candidatus Nezhaarchaeales archaeon]